jgi:hypothetical protein
MMRPRIRRRARPGLVRDALAVAAFAFAAYCGVVVALAMPG